MMRFHLLLLGREEGVCGLVDLDTSITMSVINSLIKRWITPCKEFIFQMAMFLMLHLRRRFCQCSRTNLLSIPSLYSACSSHPARQGRSPENRMEWCLRHDQTICVWNLWTGSNSCLHRKCCPGHRRSKMESILDPTTYCQAQSSHCSEVYWHSSLSESDSSAHGSARP